MTNETNSIHLFEKDRISAAQALLQDARVRIALAAQPHNFKHRAEKGETQLDWALWMMKNAGHSGRMEVVRVVERI